MGICGQGLLSPGRVDPGRVGLRDLNRILRFVSALGGLCVSACLVLRDDCRISAQIPAELVDSVKRFEYL